MMSVGDAALTTTRGQDDSWNSWNSQAAIRVGVGSYTALFPYDVLTSAEAVFLCMTVVRIKSDVPQRSLQTRVLVETPSL